MIAQHEFLRMRIEIHLLANITHIKDPDIVLDKCQRHNQRRKSSIIVGDHALQLGLLVSVESLPEISQDMLEYVDVLPHRRFHGQGFHEEFSIAGCEFLWTVLVSLTDQPSERLASLRMMGQKHIFVCCVELNQ